MRMDTTAAPPPPPPLLNVPMHFLVKDERLVGVVLLLEQRCWRRGPLAKAKQNPVKIARGHEASRLAASAKAKPSPLSCGLAHL